MEEDSALDLLVTILAVAIFLPIMMVQFAYFMSDNVGGFNVVIEKSAMVTETEIVPTKREVTTEDLILMLVVADRYSPSPKTLDINLGNGREVININNEFLGNKTFYLQRVASIIGAMGDPIDIDLFVGPSGPRFWGIR